MTTATGHIVGAVYHSRYWGGTYLVVGLAHFFGEACGVTVQCVTPGSGAHQTVGETWAHCTMLDARDRRIV